jgi:hypothetical protein
MSPQSLHVVPVVDGRSARPGSTPRAGLVLNFLAGETGQRHRSTAQDPLGTKCLQRFPCHPAVLCVVAANTADGIFAPVGLLNASNPAARQSIAESRICITTGLPAGRSRRAAASNHSDGLRAYHAKLPWRARQEQLKHLWGALSAGIADRPAAVSHPLMTTGGR